MSSEFRKPVYISIDGETKTLRQWAKDSGIPQATLYSRYKNGVSGKALIRPSYIGVKDGEKKVRSERLVAWKMGICRNIGR